MSDWIRQDRPEPGAWHQPARRSPDQPRNVVLTRCGGQWGSDEPWETSGVTEPGVDQRCPECASLVIAS